MKKTVVIFCSLFSFAVVAQQADLLDFTSANARLYINTSEKSISGLVAYKFDALKEVDSFYIDARNMEFSFGMLNYQMAKTSYDGKKLYVFDRIEESSKNEIILSFKAFPKQAMYFVGWDDEAPNQVWTQGQGKYTSNWLPSFDDENEKVIFDVLVTFDGDYEVIGNGELARRTEVGEAGVESLYDMEKPMNKLTNEEKVIEYQYSKPFVTVVSV